MFKKVVQLRITEIILFKFFLITEVNYPTDISVLKFYFASYEQFQEHFQNSTENCRMISVHSLF
jgi:hypothetical protein